MSASERGRLLWKIAELVEQNIDELAELETLDNGKPIFESRYVDMPMVADVFRYYAGWATKIHGETVNINESAFTYTLREPVGVVGAIVAWNFPLLLASWKLAPGAGLRQHRGAEAGGADAADGAAFRRTVPPRRDCRRAC